MPSVNKGTMSVVTGVEFNSYRISYVILRCGWCHIVLNMRAANEDKSDDMKYSFYEKL
jgi:hypothetical protein